MRLFHASKVQGLKILRPFPSKIVDGESVVFATSDKIFALSMSYGTGEELAASYIVNGKTREREFFLAELQEGKLNLLKNKASLYIIDSEGFRKDKRLMPEELISKKEVKVIEEIKIDNVLEELKNLGANLVPYEEVLDSIKTRKNTINFS